MTIREIAPLRNRANFSTLSCPMLGPKNHSIKKSHLSVGNSLAIQFSPKFSVLFIYLIHHQSISKTFFSGTSLVVQWLRFHTPNAGVPGLIPGQQTRSCMSQLKILCAATKTQHSQINKYWDIFLISISNLPWLNWLNILIILIWVSTLSGIDFCIHQNGLGYAIVTNQPTNQFSAS